MRANTRNAMTAWVQGKECRKASAVWSNGDHVYSYHTCMVARASDGTVIVNATKYSVTTSCQQGGIRYYLASNGVAYVEVNGLPMGCHADTLRSAYASATTGASA